MKIYYPLAKLAFVVVYLYMCSIFLPISHCVLAYIFLCYTYQVLIAKMNGVIPIPAMDQVCFISSSKSLLNVMNCTCYDAVFDPKITRHNMEKIIKHMPKLTYRIVEIFGDYYYKPMSADETFEKAITIDGNSTLKSK